jgi:hypothetical protein
METILPLTQSHLNPVESAFLGPNGVQYGVAVGLGAISQVNGECMARHPTNNGVCWGSFDGHTSKFVDNRDHDISCMYDENYLVNVQRGNAPNPTNSMTQYSTMQDPASQRSNGPWIPSSVQNAGQVMAGFNGCGSNTGISAVPCSSGSVYNSSALVPTRMGSANRPCASYGTYSNCPNCSLSGYGAASRGPCYGGGVALGANGQMMNCQTRERMRSIYDTGVQASECNNAQPSMMYS